MRGADTLPAVTEVLPSTAFSPSEEHRLFLTPGEFTHAESVSQHSHLAHAVPTESPLHSVADHHLPHSFTLESILHSQTQVDHQTSEFNMEQKHSEPRHSEREGKPHPEL